MKVLRYLYLLTFSLNAFTGICQPSNNTNKSRKLLLRDEGLSQLSYVDIANPKKNWYVPVPPGRDMQLVGDGRVLIGTGTGYEEYDIKTGKKVSEQTAFKGTLSAQRLRNGNTLLSGTDLAGKKGVVLAEVDRAGGTHRIINFPQFNYVRLVRETSSGTFLVTSDTLVFESNDAGQIIWQANVISQKRPHSWQALRLASGQTIVSSGFAANFQIFGRDGTLVAKITGPPEVNPYFYAGFQILKNGNYVVTNWQGHGADHGTSGIQLLEYSPDGKLVWSWKQDPLKFSSVQGVIVLDGLNLKLLHVEDGNGILAPVRN
jgi:hypothetical protein